MSTRSGGRKSSGSPGFTVTVVNGTRENFDPMMVSIHLQSGNTEAERIVDSANRIGGGRSTTLLPGREVKWTVGFSVGDPKDLVMEVSPEFFTSSVIFTS